MQTTQQVNTSTFTEVIEQLDAYDLWARDYRDFEFDPERLCEDHPLVVVVHALSQTFPQAVLPLPARRYWNILLRVNSFGWQDDGSFRSMPDEVIDTIAQAVSDFTVWLRREAGQTVSSHIRQSTPFDHLSIQSNAGATLLGKLPDLLDQPSEQTTVETEQPIAGRQGETSKTHRTDGRTPQARNAAVRQLIERCRREGKKPSLRYLAKTLAHSPTAIQRTPAWKAEQARCRKENATFPKGHRGRQPRQLTEDMLMNYKAGEDPMETAIRKEEILSRLLQKCRSSTEREHLLSMPESEINGLIDTITEQYNDR